MLVDLLRDPEEKTRANAAGALGNFVRNSNSLAKDLIKYKALHQLLDVVLNDKGTVYKSYDNLATPTNFALFDRKLMRLL